jgi:starch phosphorylase
MTSPQIRPDRSDLEPELDELAANYRWSWHRPTQAVLERVSSLSEAAPNAHPVSVVRALTDAHWAEICADDALVRDLRDASGSLRRVLDAAPRQRTNA